MRTILILLIVFAMHSSIVNAQSNTSGSSDQIWKLNSGIDIGAWWGGTGMSPLKAASNPLLHADLTSQTAYSGDFYLEWLKKKKGDRNDGPGLGIKTKLVWDYFTANNSSSGGSYESLTLNYINVPVLFEYCLSFKNKVTSPHTIAPSSNTQTSVYDHTYYQHVITVTTTTPGGYNPGGVPYSDAIFIYGGPQICYLAKGFHNINGKEQVINDANLKTSYVGLIGGFCFYLNHLNLDLSYQRGLTSIDSEKNVLVNGFLFKIGFNLSKRKF